MFDIIHIYYEYAYNHIISNMDIDDELEMLQR